MKYRKRSLSIIAGVMAAILILTLTVGLLPTDASAASSSEIRKQINELRQHRTKIACGLRRQIFRQIAQKRRGHMVICQGVSGEYDGKDASKTHAKPLGGLCAVMP